MEAYLPLLVLAIPLILIFSMQRRASAQRREMAATQSSVQPGQQILTTGGLHATVVAVEGEVVVLETGPGQQSRWDRRAILKVSDGAVETGRSASPPGPQDGHPPQAGSETTWTRPADSRGSEQDRS